MGQADDIREKVLRDYINPARERGESTVEVRAGDIQSSNLPNVCSAMSRPKIETLCSVKIVNIRDNQGRTGENAGPSTNYWVTYRLLLNTSKKLDGIGGDDAASKHHREVLFNNLASPYEAIGLADVMSDFEKKNHPSTLFDHIYEDIQSGEKGSCPIPDEPAQNSMGEMVTPKIEADAIKYDESMPIATKLEKIQNLWYHRIEMPTPEAINEWARKCGGRRPQCTYKPIAVTDGPKATTTGEGISLDTPPETPSADALNEDQESKDTKFTTPGAERKGAPVVNSRVLSRKINRQIRKLNRKIDRISPVSMSGSEAGRVSRIREEINRQKTLCDSGIISAGSRDRIIEILNSELAGSFSEDS